MKKLACTILILALALGCFAPAAFATAGDPTLFKVTTLNSGGVTPSVTAGSILNETFRFSDAGSRGITIKSIDIVTSTDLAVFPFEVSQTSYYQTFNASTADYVFSMRCRGDATQNYYQVPFKIEYIDPTDAVDSTGIKTVIVNVDVRVMASGSDTVVNVPKIIVSNFSTNPSQVVAGEEFTLSVTFKNTSSSTTATNIKAQLTSDGTFTPVSGSTTLFMNSIAPGSSSSQSIRLRAKADAAPGSYSVTFNINYDVAGYKDPFTDTEVLSIPVTQVPRAQVSRLQVLPTEVYVGNEVSVTSSVNNTGKSTLYNVNVTFKDSNGLLMETEQFLGNIAPGSSGAIEVYISAMMPGEAQLLMTVTYEDENGEVYTHTESTVVYIMERGNVEPIPIPEDDTKTISPLVWVALALLLAGGGLAAFLILRRRKKNAETLQEERDKVDELDALYETENPAAPQEMTGNESNTMEIELPRQDEGSGNAPNAKG